MTTTLKPVDAVVVGIGLVGTIISKTLLDQGLSVVGLERGGPRDTVPDFQAPGMHDELQNAIRLGLMVNARNETVTFRHTSADTALPIRKWGAFLLGTGVGGSAVHWNGNIWRFQEADFADPELMIQDWGGTYDQLEPHYDAFEKLYGACGKAGNLNGDIQAGGNPHEAPRSAEYPNPPMKETHSGALFRKAAESLGHKPFPMPSCTMSQPYTNPLGLKLNACVFCGFCERFGCEHYAKASPQTTILPVVTANDNFELRTNCQVLRVELDDAGEKAIGVTYVTAAGEEIFQPADLVIIGAFAFNNVRLMLLSGIGTPYDPQTGIGTVGRNCAYQTMSGVQVFFDDTVRINPFIGSGSSAVCIDEFSSDNFDHTSLGFIGGANMVSSTFGGRPIGFHPTPPGTPCWGQDFKEAMVRHYNHTATITVQGSSMPMRGNYLDLDPTYKDAWSLPLLRMTFDFPDNDVRMSRYVTDRAAEIGAAMGGTQVAASARQGPFDSRLYQSTHNTGGAIMGADPTTSTVNPSCKAGMSPMSSSSAPRPSPTIPPTTRRIPLARWPTGRRTRWPTST